MLEIVMAGAVENIFYRKTMAQCVDFSPTIATVTTNRKKDRPNTRKGEREMTTKTGTCIVGLVHGGKVYIGGDSAGTDSWLNRSIRVDEKVFVKEEMIFGFTSSFRMGQILRYSFTPAKQFSKETAYEYLCSRFIDGLIKCLKDKGFAKVEDNEVSGGTFLLGFHGVLYRIENDFQVGRRVDNYDAVGCGQDFAMGALHNMERSKLSPRVKIRRALEAAEKFSAGVKRPFKIVSI